MRKIISKQLKRIVIKIGSGLLTGEQGLKKGYFSKLSAEIKAIRQKKIEVVIVSSGAIACGMGLLGLKERPIKISQKQAVASLGQPQLIQHYARAFNRNGLQVSQILITREDLQDRHRFLTAKHAMNELFDYGVIPIVNENDTVATDEIQVGDNDQLSAMVAHLIDADLLVLMTDTDGFFDRDPKQFEGAQRLSIVENVDEKTERLASGTISARSTGGMVTKLKAAQQAATFGVPTWIISGLKAVNLRAMLKGEDIGTLFLPRKDQLSARKYWIAHSMKVRGRIMIDAGAEGALLKNNKSLLPSGITAVEGHFMRGDCVGIVNDQGREVARGLANYDAVALAKIRGHRSHEIEALLGYKFDDEVINRDDLTIL